MCDCQEVRSVVAKLSHFVWDASGLLRATITAAGTKICQSCYIYFLSKLLHVFVKVVLCICKSCYMYFCCCKIVRYASGLLQATITAAGTKPPRPHLSGWPDLTRSVQICVDVLQEIHTVEMTGIGHICPGATIAIVHQKDFWGSAKWSANT